eukprot:TRINITY_DN2215_c0_g1_i1.p1 TRINITY_DN2215_c0_g1~~TRINITY_DN2215_c0_g1_i1.p1  ORF type:complete len:538 (+),score=45.63 TRINITY_DN2215_c0_g1_i1:302-1915(+)
MSIFLLFTACVIASAFVPLCHSMSSGHFEGGCPAFESRQTFPGAFTPPATVLSRYKGQRAWACCGLCQTTRGCAYWTWTYVEHDQNDMPSGECSLYTRHACNSQQSDSNSSPSYALSHLNAISASIEYCDMLSLKAHMEEEREKRTQQAQKDAEEESKRKEYEKQVAEIERKRLEEEEVAQEGFAVCPPEVELGGTVQGGLRSLEGPDGEYSRLPFHFMRIPLLACCEGCALNKACKYFSWMPAKQGLEVGLCALFRNFGCQQDKLGNFPLEFHESHSVTGSSVSCAAIRRQGNASSATIVLPNPPDLSSGTAKSTSEETGRGSDLSNSNREEPRLTSERKQAAAAHATSATPRATSASRDAALPRHVSTLSFQRMQRAKGEREERDEWGESVEGNDSESGELTAMSANFVACPSFAEGQIVDGFLRNLESPQGDYSMMERGAKGRRQMDCCHLCGSTRDCKFWSWLPSRPQDDKGDCVFYRFFACSSDSHGFLPLDLSQRGSRTGVACTSWQVTGPHTLSSADARKVLIDPSVRVR